MELLKPCPEILLNAKQVTQTQDGDSYEFILNSDLKVVECVRIDSLLRGAISPIHNVLSELNGLLFELFHVRVNPQVDNSIIIGILTNALSEIGVNVLNQPKQDSMEVCYRPLGEISANVRFYLSFDKRVIFLSPASRPRIISSNLKNIVKLKKV